jgi:uncharacterized small protein (DUF1192 family)
MDWDDLKPKPVKTPAVGDDLKALSIAELEARITAFEAEIARVRTEMASKKAQQDAASRLFKS